MVQGERGLRVRDRVRVLFVDVRGALLRVVVTEELLDPAGLLQLGCKKREREPGFFFVVVLIAQGELCRISEAISSLTVSL